MLRLMGSHRVGHDWETELKTGKKNTDPPHSCNSESVALGPSTKIIFNTSSYMYLGVKATDESGCRS